MTKKKLRKRVRKLEQLIKHAWVHDGYPCLGFKQMTTPQKKLYCEVIECDYEEYADAFFNQVRALKEERKFREESK